MTVLAYLELLVAKRLARVVTYTRLPTGHGHSDIDGCFAVIWEKVKHIHVHTMEEYERAIKAAYRKKENVDVVDVEVVPDWQGSSPPY